MGTVRALDHRDSDSDPNWVVDPKFLAYISLQNYCEVKMRNSMFAILNIWVKKQTVQTWQIFLIQEICEIANCWRILFIKDCTIVIADLQMWNESKPLLYIMSKYEENALIIYCNCRGVKKPLSNKQQGEGILINSHVTVCFFPGGNKEWISMAGCIM